MAIYFRRKINIIPGVSINVSKSGISTTLGMKGAHVTIGNNRSTISAGIPGSGVYYRKTYTPSKTRRNKSRPNSSSIAYDFQSYNDAMMNDVPINSDGEISNMIFVKLLFYVSLGLSIIVFIIALTGSKTYTYNVSLYSLICAVLFGAWYYKPFKSRKNKNQETCNVFHNLELCSDINQLNGLYNELFNQWQKTNIEDQIYGYSKADFIRILRKTYKERIKVIQMKE